MSHKPSLKQLHQAQVTKYNTLLIQREELEAKLMQAANRTKVLSQQLDFEGAQMQADYYQSLVRRLEIVNIKIGECIV